MKLTWSGFVDVITIIWLVIFILTFIDLGNTINLLLKYILLSFLIIFILDLYILYKRAENFKMFIKKHWFDVLMVIPFFRILRIFRVFKLLKVTKSVKSGLKISEKTSKAIKKTKRIAKKKKLKQN
jgi:hypothetical protein